MTNIAKEKERLLTDLTTSYDKNLNKQVLYITFIYTLLSISWNLLFRWFNLPFSRANLSILFSILFVWCLVYFSNRLTSISSQFKTYILAFFSVYIIISLYFGSGYSESWSYFLLIPVVISLYGKKALLLFSSTIGFISLTIVSFFFPVGTYYETDTIDLSNRLLLYLIVATFSYLLLIKLNMLYDKQVNTVIHAMELKLEQVVQSFIVAMEAKDAYTFGHSERVSQYAVAIAQQLPQYQDENKLKNIRLSGLLHDIGKIHISDDILTKPDKLTKSEFEVVKSHTTIGAQMVEKVEGLEGLKCGVLYHHERWDGTGYPKGAQGLEIPLEARILAVADAFDAMTSTRAYRRGLSFNEAYSQVLTNLGTQFDPNLREAIESAKEAILKIHVKNQNNLDDLEKLTDFL
ncbi:HD-GYP domain-containing protein [Alkalibacterium psychrotolerans]